MAKSFFQIELDNGTTNLILTNNPAGIEDFTIDYKTHQVYGTVFREIGSSLRFVKEGRQFLKEVFDVYGLDSYCTINIDLLDLETKTYLRFWEGTIDFSTYKEDAVFVEVSTAETGAIKTFFTRENIPVNLLASKTLDGDTPSSSITTSEITIPPVDLVFTSGGVGAIGYLFTTTPTTNPFFVYPSSTDPDNVNYIGGDYDVSKMKYTNSGSAGTKIKFSVVGSLHLLGTFGISAGSPSDQAQLKIEIKRFSGATLYTYTKDVLGVAIVSVDFTYSPDFDYTSIIGAGSSEGLYMELTTAISGSPTLYFNFNFSGTFSKYELTLIEDSPLSSESIECFKPFDAFKKILDIMDVDSSEISPTSTVLGTGGDYENLMITDGRWLRGFYKQSFNLSFRDLFINLSKILGLRLSKNFAIERHSYFFGSTVGIVITDYSNLERVIGLEKYVNIINCGYENKDYNEKNGLIEFNNEAVFTTRNRVEKSEVDLVSEFRADTIGIEYQRRINTTDEGTTDADGDDDKFIINGIVDGAIIRAKVGADYTTISGFANIEQFFNVELSPKHILINNGIIPNTSLYHFTKEVQLAKSRNNIPLVVDGVEELDGDYNASGSKTLKPEYVTFDTYLTQDLISFLDGDNTEKIQVGDYVGYLIEASINLYKKNATIKILLV